MKAVYKITFLNLSENAKVEYYFYTDNVRKALARVPTGKLIEVECLGRDIMDVVKNSETSPALYWIYYTRDLIHYHKQFLANKVEDIIDNLLLQRAEIESIKQVQTNIEIVE